jgi:histidinol dehydrogenase
MNTTMIRREALGRLSARQREQLCVRPGRDISDIEPAVREIIAAVAAEGDGALRRFTGRFDRYDGGEILVSTAGRDRGAARVSAPVRAAITAAANGIRSFHAAQMPVAVSVTTAPGVSCWLEWRPIECAGLYIPGGSAPLISTALMLGIPAVVAGCPKIVIATPPRPDGSIADEILYVAQILGIDCIIRAGGAQAIAALAFGTASVPRAGKIFGPGNRYVTAAKALVSQPPWFCPVDVLAGPSELLVIADESCPPAWAAADLISQAEHGPDSQVVLVAMSDTVADAIQNEINLQLAELPRREVAEKALASSFIIVAPDLPAAIDFSNQYAPEHLILAVSEPDRILPRVMNAGSVFAGRNSSVVFGDYASGTNHTLPTSGLAAVTGGVTLQSFLKPVSFQSLTDTGVESLSGVVATLARVEGLEGHARAAEIRRAGS